MSKVIVGMSGGVDSSVTAYLLKEQGYDVEGVSFIIWEARERSNYDACCSFEATGSAAKTAQKIGISHRELDVREAFIDEVIEPFTSAYGKGVTPNPCILCNMRIKFPLLLEEAKRRNAEFIATGHYARIARNGREAEASAAPTAGKSLLKKGADPRKDQSYVLYGLRPEELARLVLPLGKLTKKEVREIARSLRLPAAERPESQEICFIGEEGYAKFIENLSTSSSEPGRIVDKAGNTLGSHKGICHYTIGQRKGLGISFSDPRYVTAIDPLNNLIRVGKREEVLERAIEVAGLNWLASPPSRSFRATVKIRSMMDDVPATIELCNGHATVLFDDPQWAPAPGQSAVFYLDETVLGGGIITQIHDAPSSNITVT
jgi:tRNA-specific 2-thiouridylase